MRILSACLLLLAACSGAIPSIPCSSDAECPTGYSCGAAKQCVEGTASCAANQFLCGTECRPVPCDQSLSVPAAPTGLAAAASGTAIALSWSASTGAASYAVQRGTVSGGPYSGVGTSTTTSFNDTSVQAGTTYFYVVLASNGAGTSARSAEASATATSGATAPSAPRNVTATGGAKSANVSWAAPLSTGGQPVTGYKVTSSPDGKTATTTGATTATVTGLSNNTNYRFTVTATNSVGESVPSTQSAQVLTADVPGAPTAVKATPQLQSATVTWTAPASDGRTAITGYVVTASPGPATVATTGAGTSATIPGLSDATHYSFSVAAVNGAGTGAGSSVSNTVSPGPLSLTVVSGANQAASQNQPLASPVVVKLVDASGDAVPAAQITAAGPGWASTLPTDASGQVTFQPRLGRTLGVASFAATTTYGPGANAPFDETTNEVDAGFIYPVINASHTEGQPGASGAGAGMPFGKPSAMAVAPDGTLYVATGALVFKLAPDGLLTRIAGGGTASPAGSPALQAQFQEILDLALDATNKVLYVGDHTAQFSDTVFALDLQTGLLSAFAGGGGATGPGFGDNGPATSASLLVLDLEVGPDAKLYIVDGNGVRIRRVDPATGTISAWLSRDPANSCGANDVKISAFTAQSQVVFDPDGTAFIVAAACNAAWGAYPSNYAQNALVRRDPDGSIAVIGGYDNGSEADTTQSYRAKFSSFTRLALDAAGNLYFTQGDKLRRIDALTAKLSTLAGTGTAGFAGEYVAATGAQFSYPRAIGIDAGGTLYVADYQNATVRAVSKAGSATAATATLSIGAGDAQTSYVSGSPAAPLTASLNSAAVAIGGVGVEWRSLTRGAGVYGSRVTTTSAGNSSVVPRAGLDVSTDQFEASFTNLRGKHVGGSPVTFSLNVVAPPAGTVFTAVNAAKQSGYVVGSGPGALYTIGGIDSVVGVPGEALLISLGSSNPLLKLESDGFIAPFLDPAPSLRHMQFDALNNRIVASSSTPAGKSIVYALDLSTKALTTIAGGGSCTAVNDCDGGQATDATLQSSSSAVGPDGTVYISGQTGSGYLLRIRKVDPTTGIISHVIGMPNAASCTVGIRLTSPSGDGLAIDSLGNLYFAANICGTSVADDPTTGDNRHAIMMLSSTGTLSVWAFLPSTLEIGEIAVDASRNLYLNLTSGSGVYKVNATTKALSLFAGTGTGGQGADYVAATTSALGLQVRGLTFLSSGRFAIGDNGNNCVRVIW